MIDVEFVTACKYQIVAKWQYKQTFCSFEITSKTSYCVLPIGMKLYIKTNDIGPNNLNTLQKNIPALNLLTFAFFDYIEYKFYVISTDIMSLADKT